MERVIRESMEVIEGCLLDSGLLVGDIREEIEKALVDKWGGYAFQVWSVEDVDILVEEREIDPNAIGRGKKIAMLNAAVHREGVYGFIYDLIGAEIDDYMRGANE